jgi:hypothetical protein
MTRIEAGAVVIVTPMNSSMSVSAHVDPGVHEEPTETLGDVVPANGVGRIRKRAC